MNLQETNDSPGMLHALFDLCMEKATGTFFVATEDNKSCQIVVEQGVLTRSSFGQHKGFATLTVFKSLRNERHSFTPNLLLPMDASATIEHSDEALAFLGYENKLKQVADSEEQITESVVTPEPVKTERKLVGMYRGQPVYKEIEITDAVSTVAELETVSDAL